MNHAAHLGHIPLVSLGFRLGYIPTVIMAAAGCNSPGQNASCFFFFSDCKSVLRLDSTGHGVKLCVQPGSSSDALPDGNSKSKCRIRGLRQSVETWPGS